MPLTAQVKHQRETGTQEVLIRHPAKCSSTPPYHPLRFPRVPQAPLWLMSAGQRPQRPNPLLGADLRPQDVGLGVKSPG